MRNTVITAFWLLTHTSFSQATSLTFKEDPIKNINWFPYILALGFLFTILLVLAKKSKILIKQDAQCKVIEHIPLNHKTKVFILDYQGQRFLLADNQHSLAIHPLSEGKPPYE